MADRNHAKRLGKRKKDRTPGPKVGGGGSPASGGLNWSRTLNPRSKGAAGRPKATPVCLELAAALDEMKDAVPRAQLAADVYDVYDPKRDPKLPPPKPPEGLTRVSDHPAAMRKLLPGLSDEEIKDLTHPDNSSYRAAVYQDESGKNFLVFRGTENKEGLKDWKENGLQGAGLQSEHYEKAKRLAFLMSDSPGGEDMEIVGHSKGGGMAAAAGIVTGAKTTTFNAAGVHPNTVNGSDPMKASENVNSYVVDGEVLNWVQDNREVVQGGLTALAAKAAGPLGGVGAAIALAGTLPPSVGKRTALPAVWNDEDKPAWYDPVMYRVTLHGMPKVLAGIEARQAALRKDYETNGCTTQLGPR